MLLAFLWIAIAAYLLGSIPVGYLLVRIFRRQDIRTVGSGNIGATNVLRSGGKVLGAATFILDVCKGALAVLLASMIAGSVLPTVPPRNVEALARHGSIPFLSMRSLTIGQDTACNRGYRIGAGNRVGQARPFR